jgi:hypothetical protein
MNDQKDLDQLTREPIIPQKVRFIDADGHHWRVYEVAAPAFDRRAGTHLVFHAEAVMRRVRNFPPNWDELSNEGLYALTDQSKA